MPSLTKTNRETLHRIIVEIQSLADDDAISPTPYDHLYQAIRSLNEAARFVLDVDERDTGHTASERIRDAREAR